MAAFWLHVVSTTIGRKAGMGTLLPVAAAPQHRTNLTTRPKMVEFQLSAITRHSLQRGILLPFTRTRAKVNVGYRARCCQSSGSLARIRDSRSGHSHSSRWSAFTLRSGAIPGQLVRLIHVQPHE